MTKIYHHYKHWEDYKNGFYNNVSSEKRNELINKVIELFSDTDLTERYMNRVIEEWPKACEQNLSNISMNRIAYLGQAACCIYCGSPYMVTMNAWNLVGINYRLMADNTANKIIKQWEQNQKLKNTLMNGNQKDMNQEYQMKLPLN